MKLKEITFPYVWIMASLVLWLLSINQIPVYDYTADTFWYARNLPVSYWIGLALTLFTAFWYTNTKEIKKRGFEVLLILIFTLYLFGTLSFATNNPYFLDIYGHTSEVKIIGELGNISTPVETPHLDTPGSYIFFAIFRSIVGHDFFDTVVKYYPICVIAILSIIVYITARLFLVSQKALIAPIAFMSFAFFTEFHISRQSFGLILFSILLLSISEFLRSKKIQWPLIFIITNISLVISHPGAPIFFSISLASALLLINLPWFKSKISKPKKSLKILLLFSFVVCFCWCMYFTKAIPWFEDDILFLKHAFENLLGLKLSLTPELTQNPSYEFGVVILIREIILLLEITIGISSMVFLWINNVRLRHKTLFLGGFLAGCITLGSLFLFGHAYTDRLFLYALFPVSLLSALSFNIKRKSWRLTLFLSSLTVILVASMILIPISGYGSNLPFECPSSAEISLGRFAKASLPNGTRLAGLGEHGGLVAEAIHSGSLTVYPWRGWGSPLPRECDLMIVNIAYNFYTLRFGTSTEYKKLENEALAFYDKVYDSGLGRLYKSIQNR